MKLLSGLEQVNQLPAESVRRFHEFCRAQVAELTPRLLDIGFIFVVIGSILLFQTQPLDGLPAGQWHPLQQLYLFLLIGLGLLHRFSRIREFALVTLYIQFFLLAAYIYLEHVFTNTVPTPMNAVSLYLALTGFNTLSIKHTSILIGLNLALLYGTLFAISAPGQAFSLFTALTLNWWFISFMTMSLVACQFSCWLHANLFAFQFLIEENNSSLIQAVEKLNEKEQELIQQQKHQALSHMASHLLQDIETPVKQSLILLEQARQLNMNNEVLEAIDDATANQQRLNHILDDLKTFSTNTPDTPPELTSIKRLLEQAIKYCRNELDGIHITQTEVVDDQVTCYPNAFMQVLVNVLLNAADALANKKAEGLARIEIRLNRTGSDVVVTIQDNGKGIRTDKLHRLTEPFFSAREEQGYIGQERMGLGLSICQTIMKQHRGNIMIESELGAWTRVILSLPISGGHKNRAHLATTS